jgi:hypothetical protein
MGQLSTSPTVDQLSCELFPSLAFFLKLAVLVHDFPFRVGQYVIVMPDSMI